MLKRPLFIFSLLIVACLKGSAQDKTTIQLYIETYKEMAIAEMHRSGIPASITLAQGIHETTAGTSPLVLKSNNHFGIKCKSNWTGERVSHTDDAPNECFRKYADPADSYRDHSDFLRNGARYAFLFDLDPLDYKGWANGLKKAGYATNPRYPMVLIKLVEEYGLQDYTLIALERKENGEEHVAVIEMPESEKKEQVKVEQREAAKPLTTSPPVGTRSYPSGEFRINDTKVIFVMKGTSYLAIAKEHDIPLKRLFEFNEMETEEAASEDRLIYLQRKRKTGASEFHIVKSGETLATIARDQAIRLESLMQYNNLSGGMEPAPGEQLHLRKKSAATPRLLTRSRP